MSDEGTDWLNFCPINWLTGCLTDRLFGGLTVGF
jgi:hypothetical protein